MNLRKLDDIENLLKPAYRASASGAQMDRSSVPNVLVKTEIPIIFRRYRDYYPLTRSEFDLTADAWTKKTSNDAHALYNHYYESLRAYYGKFDILRNKPSRRSARIATPLAYYPTFECDTSDEHTLEMEYGFIEYIAKHYTTHQIRIKLLYNGHFGSLNRATMQSTVPFFDRELQDKMLKALSLEFDAEHPSGGELPTQDIWEKLHFKFIGDTAFYVVVRQFEMSDEEGGVDRPTELEVSSPENWMVKSALKYAQNLRMIELDSIRNRISFELSQRQGQEFYDDVTRKKRRL